MNFQRNEGPLPEINTGTKELLDPDRDQLLAFFEDGVIGLHWVGPDGIILWANRVDSEMVGYSHEEYIGMNIADVHADADAIEDILDRLARGEKLRDYEARLKCKDGSIKTVLIDSSVLWDKGRFLHSQCFTRDITDRKRTEEALRATQIELARANEELERRVEERTASLSEAIKQLEEFSHTVSHDLRAPLRGILTYSTILLDDHGKALSAESASYVRRIADNAGRLDRMVTDVLAYSKAVRGEQPTAPVSLVDLVTALLTSLRALQPPGTQIEVGPLFDVMAHAPSLSQAVENLLGNALKFVRAGVPPKIRIWSEVRGSRVRLWVEDNGIGIPPAHQGRIFAIFERVHAHLPYEGSGVGLAIVKKAVSRSGGEVGVESDGLNGSRFWIELPKVG
jgi:PAS domain S-box-containing protein